VIIALATSVVNTAGTSAGRLQLYPNPNSGRFTVAVDGDRAGVRTAIEVINPLGQAVYFREIITEKKSWSMPVELSDVASGIYLLRLRDENGRTSTIRFNVED
jgi:hypothetical protein